MSKKNFINATHIEGYLYEHKLEMKVTGANSKNPGTNFISGTIGIATDDSMNNVVQIHFTYVTAVTAKGKPNNTFNTLQNIINGKLESVMEHGKENAVRLRVDSALALNEWYDTRDDNHALISVKRNEGGFVHLMTMAEPLNENVHARATFDCDMLITKATRVEANEERNTPEKVTIKGYVFDFRKALLPVEFSVLNPKAMNYFEDQEPSEKHPLFTRVKGEQISQTIERKIEEESAFGDTSVRIVRSSQRDFVITWAPPQPYEWDDETTLLASELLDMQAAREVYLADMKKRQDEYLASRNNVLAEAPAAPKKDDYDF